jgi:hypothetical protein
MIETIIKPTDLSMTDGGEVVLVVDIKTAKEAFLDRYEVDDEGGHIWLGGDNVVPHTDILVQICSVRGLEWIHLDRLTTTVD